MTEVRSDQHWGGGATWVGERWRVPDLVEPGACPTPRVLVGGAPACPLPGLTALAARITSGAPAVSPEATPEEARQSPRNATRRKWCAVALTHSGRDGAGGIKGLRQARPHLPTEQSFPGGKWVFGKILSICAQAPDPCPGFLSAHVKSCWSGTDALFLTTAKRTIFWFSACCEFIMPLPFIFAILFLFLSGSAHGSLGTIQ